MTSDLRHRLLEGERLNSAERIYLFQLLERDQERLAEAAANGVRQMIENMESLVDPEPQFDTWAEQRGLR